MRQRPPGERRRHRVISRVVIWWENCFAGHSWRRARDVDVLTHIFALMAQLVLCAAPLLIAASALVRRAGGQGLGPPLTHFLGLDGAAARTVTALFAASGRANYGDLVVGLVASAVLGTGVAATQQRGYSLIWGLPGIGLRGVWRHVVWTIGLAGYTALILGASQLGDGFPDLPALGLVVRCSVTLAASLIFYTWSQHLLLGGRISYRRLLPGATFIAVGVTVLVLLSALTLSPFIHQQVTDYGLIGAAFILSIWLAVLSGLIFAGVLFGAVLDERRADEPMTEPWLRHRGLDGASPNGHPEPSEAPASEQQLKTQVR
jgi:membrane protein